MIYTHKFRISNEMYDRYDYLELSRPNATLEEVTAYYNRWIKNFPRELLYAIHYEYFHLIPSFVLNVSRGHVL